MTYAIVRSSLDVSSRTGRAGKTNAQDILQDAMEVFLVHSIDSTLTCHDFTHDDKEPV
jgi:hypothetical protein